MMVCRRNPVYLIIWFLAVFAASGALGSASDEETPLPNDLTPALGYLLSLNRAVRPLSAAFDVRRIEPVLRFVAMPKSVGKRYHADKSLGTPSAYGEFEVNTSLAHVLQIAYNPELPGALCAPSSLRVCAWKQVNGGPPPIPKLWKLPPTTDRPVIVKGLEHEEITPDAFTGAYYAYDQDRTLILFRHGGRRVLISLTGQKDRSSVGKKGLILGPDEDWNYLYTGKRGLNVFGLGWVSSYMFDSCSILVYEELGTAPPRVKVAVFKWVRAGWKGINVVERTHIHAGIQRMASAFKFILENTRVEEIASLETAMARIGSQSQAVLRSQTERHFEHLRHRLESSHKSDGEKLETFLNDADSLRRLSRTEMVSLLSLETLKGFLGKPSAASAVFTKF